MAHESPYGVRLLTAIRKQCDRRGIPPEEMESVLAHVEDEYGESVHDMGAPKLRRVQQNLDDMFREYLGGRKRRTGPPGAWEVNATKAAITHAAIHGVDVQEIEGTGAEGRVTKDDVEAHLANV